MAYFGIITKGGELIDYLGTPGYVFEHPCYAWVGHTGRDQWDTILLCLPGGVSSSREDLDLLLSRLQESSLRHAGFEFGAHLDHPLAKRACISVKLNPEAKFYETLRVLKMAGKVWGYSKLLYDTFMGLLRQGANWQEASFLTVKTTPYNYSYPYPKGVTNTQIREYLLGGPMADLSVWSERARRGSTKLFTQDPTTHRGAWGACHPLTMGDGPLIRANTLDDLRKEFDYE